MPKSTTFANDIMLLIFNATPIASLADNAASGPATNLYLSLHTASPGIGGSQLTNEAAYTNYVRVPVARTAGGWTVAGGVVSNAALISFAQCGASGATLTHWAVGTASSGAGKVLMAGALTSPLVVSQGNTPQFAIGAVGNTET